MKETESQKLVDARYRVVREIARGGLGTVFEARHEFTGRPVAVKLLRPEQVNNTESQARLLREAQVLYLARHPNVLEVYDAGLARTGEVFLVTELVEGRSLSGLLAARGKLGVADTVQIARQVISALQGVHRNGLVHRDIKPDNILLVRDGATDAWRVKLVDFGAAKYESGDAKLTKAGEVLGTPEYMAMEQLLSEDVDHRADIYGLGISMYECLTGTVPYPGNFGQVLLAVSSGQYPPMGEVVPDVPGALQDVVRRATSPKAADRFQDAAAFGEALDLAVPNGAGRQQQPFAAKRRVFARATYVTPIRLMVDAETPCDGRTEDISQGGALVMVEREVPLGATLRLRFALPITGRVLEVDGVAKWTREQRGRRATGIEFVGLPADAAEPIQRYVELMGAPA